MSAKCATVLICFLVAGGPFASAGDRLQLAVEAGAARMDGTSYERVYTQIDHGPLNGKYHRLSELVWDIEGVYGVRAAISLGFDRRFEWSASAFCASTEGTGGMEDYDWFLYDRPDYWTHLSRSTVQVQDAVDADLRGTLHITRDRPLVLDAMLGWRYMNFRWEDRGLDYVYSSLGDPGGTPDHGYSYEQIDPDAVRDLTGGDGRVGILYEQTFHIPYAGIGIGLGRGRFRARGEFLYSPIVAAQDSDTHVLRELVFDGTFVGGTYIAWKASLICSVMKHLSISASYESQEVKEFRGDMAVSQGGSQLGTLNDGASVEHESRQVTVALGLEF